MKTGGHIPVRGIAFQYNLQIIYAFGSRAKEALDLVEGRIEHFASIPSDLDIGAKPAMHVLQAFESSRPVFPNTIG